VDKVFVHCLKLCGCLTLDLGLNKCLETGLLDHLIHEPSRSWDVLRPFETQSGVDTRCGVDVPLLVDVEAGHGGFVERGCSGWGETAGEDWSGVNSLRRLSTTKPYM